MAEGRKNDLFGKLAELSDEAMQRLSDAPGGERLLGVLNATRDRVDELQKRVRGLEDLEKRLAALEQKVEKLGKSSSSAPTQSSGASSAKKS